jgi:exonuclease SbcD
VMGHLFASGGQTAEGDGVRELYVGSLAQIDAGMFPPSADYVALGHLHMPQRVQGAELRRYSGSPLPMGFGEAGQAKSVVLVDMHGGQASASLLVIPVFQPLERISGDRDAISIRLRELKAAKSTAWLEVTYDGEAAAGTLQEWLDEAIAGTCMEILRVRNNRIMERALQRQHPDETLDDLTHTDVFERCMEAHGLPAEQRSSLRLTYMEAFRTLSEADTLAR